MQERSAINPGSDKSRERDGVTRRHVLKKGVTTGTVMLASLSAPAVITPARAAERISKVGMYSTPRTELIKTTLIKHFEARHRVKFLIDEGLTTKQLARLRCRLRRLPGSPDGVIHDGGVAAGGQVRVRHGQ